MRTGFGCFGLNFDMFKAMVTFDRTQGIRELQDLEYLLEQLKKLQDVPTTTENFRDVIDTWLSLFDLITKITSERGLSVLECMASNKKLLKAIGAGRALRHVIGEKPASLILIVSSISQDCGAYIRVNNYHFLKAINKEIAVVNRTRDHQNRAILFFGTAFTSVMIGFFTALARIWGDAVNDSKNTYLVWLVPVVVVVAMILTCFLICGIYRCLKGGDVKAGGYTAVSQGR
jgi:hypothetical protein